MIVPHDNRPDAARRAAVRLLGLVLVAFGIAGGARAQSSDELRYVRIGPLADRAAVESTLDALTAEGIEHFLLPEAADGSVEISVGVFRVPANADRMAERVRALGIEPVHIVVPGRSTVAGLQASSDQPPPDGLYEVRYGWFDDPSAAEPDYRQLAAAGFDPRLLVFGSTGGATIGLGVFDEREGAGRQVAQLTELGFGNGRIYAVDEAEAQRRRLRPGMVPDEQPGGPAVTDEIDEDEPKTAVASLEPSTVPEPDAVPAAEPEIFPSDQAAPGPSPTSEIVPEYQLEAVAPPPGTIKPLETVTQVDGRTLLTLSDAVTYAQRHSPELEQLALEVALSETGVRRAWGLVQPKIIAQHVSTRNDDDTVEYFNRVSDGANLVLGQLGLPPTVPPFAYKESHHSEIMLTQNLFSSGANRFRISGARAIRDASLAHQQDRTAGVLLDVLRAFLDLARQAEVIGLREESLARAERSLESVQRRFSLGLVARAEVLRWQVQVSGERVQLIEARNLYDVGLENFKRLIGFPPPEPLSLRFPTLGEIDDLMSRGIADLAATGSPTTEEWLDGHAAVTAARHEARAARMQRRAAGADFWPTLDLDGSVGYLENDTLQLDEFMQWSARLRLTLPIWDGGVRANNRAEAKTRESLAELQLDVVEDELFVLDRSIIADLRADLAALENARAAVAQATETMDSVTNKAALGLVDYIQRIDAQVILTQSLVAETSARYQFVIDLFRWWRLRDPERLSHGELP